MLQHHKPETPNSLMLVQRQPSPNESEGKKKHYEMVRASINSKNNQIDSNYQTFQLPYSDNDETSLRQTSFSQSQGPASYDWS